MTLKGLLQLFGDRITRGLKTVDYPHHEIHDGRGFLAVYSALKDTSGYIEVRIRPNDATRRCHMIVHVESALAATAELWKATTKVHVVANAITPLNRDFTNPHDSILNICHTPAGSQAGAADLLEYLGSPTTPARADVGGSTSSRGEFILRPFEDYLIKLTSRSDNNALSIILDWYEHVHKI